jgi:8-oxo-dGTP pyrophosphatase MutT (NUDIX family)
MYSQLEKIQGAKRPIIIYMNNNTIHVNETLVENENRATIHFTEDTQILDLIKLIEDSHRNLQLIATDATKVIDSFRTQIKVIQAGGGIVKNEDNKYLFIYRRGKWDLPKGKKEYYEDINTAAIREVEEETGIKEISEAEWLFTSYHIYKEDGAWVLKETFWYNMKAPNQQLVPQQEEGIKKAEWFSKEDFRRVYANTYPNIMNMVKEYLDS